MKHSDDKIRNLFSSKLKNFKVSNMPVSSMWDEIEQVLSSKEVLVIGHRSSHSHRNNSTKKRVVLLAGLAAIAASIATVLILVPSSEDLKIKPVAEQHLPILENDDDVPKSTDSTPSLNVEKKVASKVLALIQPSSPASSSVRRKSELMAGSSFESTANLVKEDHREELPVSDRKSAEVNNQVQNEQQEETLTAQKKMQEKDLPEDLPYKYPDVEVGEVAKEKKKSSSGFSLGTKTSMGILSTSESENIGAGKLFSRFYRSSIFLDAVDETHNKIKLKHRQPVSAGLLVSKELTSRLSLETGLVYTHLSSKVESSELFDISEEQKFDYLGIPLNVNYIFLKVGRADIYASLGVMVQKDINGSYESRVQVNNLDAANNGVLVEMRKTVYMNESGRLKESIHQSHVQVSGHTLLGVSYPIYKELNVYGTVGGGYYIDAKNKYETIYSDKKAQLDLNLGLKLKF